MGKSVFYLSNNFVFRGDEKYTPEYVAYNIHSGESYEVDKSIFDFLSNIPKLNNFKYSKELYRKLYEFKKINFISENYSDNKIILYHSLNKAVKTCYYPREVEFHLTSKCNLRCRYCVYDVKLGSSNAFLDYSTISNFFRELEENGLFRLVISGGEPFLHRDIYKIISDLGRRRFRVEILTNATLITEKAAEVLSSPNISITYSIDGSNSIISDFTRGKGVFEKVIKSINLLNRFNVVHNAACVVSKHNLNDIKNIIKLAEDIGSKSVNFIFLDIIGRADRKMKDMKLSDDDIREVLNTVNGIKSKIKVNILNPLDFYSVKNSETDIIYCSAGTYRCAVDCFGDVYPCSYGFSEEFRMGNIKEGLMNVWHRDKWDIFRGEIKLSDLKECSLCKFAKKCYLKNCRLRGYFKYKDFYGPYPNCFGDKNYIG